MVSAHPDYSIKVKEDVDLTSFEAGLNMEVERYLEE